MENLDTMYTDATMCELSSRLGIHRPRTKFLDVQKANLTYRKQRKHSRSQTRKITRRLLDLLGKILKEIREIERGHENAEDLLSVREKNDMEIITRMYRQQKNHFRNNDSRESIPNRIVGLSKPHLSPIVEGQGSEERRVRSESQQHIGRRDIVH